jgi:hypothetical protein
MLTPYFSRWWQKRNARNNPNSFWEFVKETYLVAKHNKFKLLFWIFFLILSITGVVYFAGFTGEALLSWLLIVFLLIFGLKHLFRLVVPPEWFLHDINTGYVFLSVLIACWLGNLISQKLSADFIIPMTLVAAACFAGFFLERRKYSRYLIPGCALVLADIIWECLRLIQDNAGYTPNLILTVVVLVIAMLIGLFWFIKKPGVMPIAYLMLFQLFRFSNFTNESIYHAIAKELSLTEATNYAIYLVSWMYIAPLLLWMIGLRLLQANENVSPQHRRRSMDKLLENLKKNGEQNDDRAQGQSNVPV